MFYRLKKFKFSHFSNSFLLKPNSFTKHIFIFMKNAPTVSGKGKLLLLSAVISGSGLGSPWHA